MKQYQKGRNNYRDDEFRFGSLAEICMALV
jgi:hypothetical protein